MSTLDAWAEAADVPLSGCGALIAARRCTGCRRPVLLDLFCCEGGAALGYHRAGFCVTGVDVEPQPRYPFRFVRGYALERARRWGRLFAAVHASPPCQHWSDLAHRNGNAADHPDLIGVSRAVLRWVGRPWVIENVERTPLRDPVTLCGTTFDGLRVIRHRDFETSLDVTVAPRPCGNRHPLVFTHDKRKAHYGRLDQDTSFVQVTGGGNATLANKRAAMGGLDWMSGDGVNEAIPAAYAEYVGGFLLAAVRGERVA